MCLPIIIFHSNFSQDFFLAPEIFFVGVITLLVCATLVPRDASGTTRFTAMEGVNVVPAGPPWHDSHDWGDLLRSSRGPPCCDGEPTWWWSSTNDNEDGNWTVQWMALALGNFEWLGWRVSDLGERSFFKLLKVGFFWGVLNKKVSGENFGEVFGGLIFFHQKVDFGSSLKVEDLWLVAMGVLGDCWSSCLMRFFSSNFAGRLGQDVCCFFQMNRMKGEPFGTWESSKLPWGGIASIESCENCVVLLRCPGPALGVLGLRWDLQDWLNYFFRIFISTSG